MFFPQGELLRDSILRRAEWNQPGCTAQVMSSFTAPITSNMVPGNPIGDWNDEHGCVIRFSPPRDKSSKKKRN